MQTIVEPKQEIERLWGQQRIREDQTVRLMRYVLRADHEGKVLLHNVVTGRLAVLSSEEAAVLDQLPMPYTPVMEQLAAAHYLVPEDYDEHRRAAGMRKILMTLSAARETEAITQFTILPTTACNARCYYCFEQGRAISAMTKETADETVRFIAGSCGPGKTASLSWFGGEPTVAVPRIDQICEGLREAGIRYYSQMISNGYLFDEDLAERAVSLWHLKAIQITIDGTEDYYNRVKAYVGITGSAYSRVMRNIGLLLDRKVQVTIRMNFDEANCGDLRALLDEIVSRFGRHPCLRFAIHPINGAYEDDSGETHHGTDAWFEAKVLELSELVEQTGLANEHTELPGLRYSGCMASSSSCATITPGGYIVSCPEQYDEDQYIGNVREGIADSEVRRSWKQIAEYEKCAECVLYPYCARVANCCSKDRCQHLPVKRHRFSEAMKHRYEKSVQPIKGGETHDLS